MAARTTPSFRCPIGLGFSAIGSRSASLIVVLGLDPRTNPTHDKGARRVLVWYRMPQVIVHDLAQARVALAVAAELGVAIDLRSAPDAAGYAGVGYLKALGDLAGQELVVDCGDDAGLVMAALRTGCRKLAFSGAVELSERLADMAAHVGAAFLYECTPPTALALTPDDDARARCLAWLSAEPTPGDTP